VENYIGCFPDDIQIKLPSECRFVMNYQGNNESGSHWYGVIRKKDMAWIKDSLGFPPDDNILKLLSKNGVKYLMYSTERTQRDDDNICGIRAVESLKFEV